MAFQIKRIDSETELHLFLNVIRNSFKTVADEFGLNNNNAPSNPAFTTSEKLNELYVKAECFGMYEESIPTGFFALELSSDKTEIYIERLCVLPDKRHYGYGLKALKQAENSAIEKSIERISIGIINENTVLKDWYIKFGFREKSIKKYGHLPFTVCFLEYKLKSK